MLSIPALLYSRRAPQMAALALISFGFTGCSADMSSRLSQNPFSNPFGYQGDATGSVQPPAPVAPPREQPRFGPQASYPAVSAPQPAISAPQPAISAPQSYPSAGGATTGVSGGGPGLASYAPPAAQPNYARPAQPNYAPPAQPRLETTASVTPPRSVAAAPAAVGSNGTTIIVGTSDNLEILARRYNVTPAAILAAN